MASSPEEIQKHVKTYWMVGAALFVCTGITIALGTVPLFDLGAPGVSGADIVLGLAVACFKTSLVVLIFMHLNHERGLIYKTLVFTMAFAASLMGLTFFAQRNPIREHADIHDRVPDYMTQLLTKEAEAEE